MCLGSSQTYPEVFFSGHLSFRQYSVEHLHYTNNIYPYPESVLNCGQLTKLIYDIKHTRCFLDWNLIGERGKSKPYCLGVSCKSLAIAFATHCLPTLLEAATLWSLWS